MIQMKRILLAFLLAILLCNLTFAQDNNRWKLIYTNGDYIKGVYVDLQNYSYDKSSNSINYWEKHDAFNEITYQKKVAYLNKMEVQTLGYTWLKDGRPAGFQARNYVDYEPIVPDSPNEKAVNIYCKLLNLPPMFNNTKHEWKWVYSNKSTNYYICTDIHFYLPEIDSEIVFMKMTNSDNDLYPDYDALLFSFKTQMFTRNYFYRPDKLVWDNIVPESVEDYYYQVAKEWRESSRKK